MLFQADINSSFADTHSDTMLRTMPEGWSGNETGKRCIARSEDRGVAAFARLGGDEASERREHRANIRR